MSEDSGVSVRTGLDSSRWASNAYDPSEHFSLLIIRVITRSRMKSGSVANPWRLEMDLVVSLW